MGIALPSGAGAVGRHPQHSGAKLQAERGAPGRMRGGLLERSAGAWREPTPLRFAPVVRSAVGALMRRSDFRPGFDEALGGRDRGGQQAPEREEARIAAPPPSARFPDGHPACSGDRQRRWDQPAQPLREAPSSTVGVRAETLCALDRQHLREDAPTDRRIPHGDTQHLPGIGRKSPQGPSLGDRHWAGQRPELTDTYLIHACPLIPILTEGIAWMSSFALRRSQSCLSE